MDFGERFKARIRGNSGAKGLSIYDSHCDVSTRTSKIFIGFMEISQVTLMVAKGVRTP